MANQAEDRLRLLGEFMKHPRQVATVAPSSRYLERCVIAAAGIRRARTVVELGAGTARMTRAILRVMPKETKLLRDDPLQPTARSSLSVDETPGCPDRP